MTKSTLFALLGLAAALTFASPTKANAGVVIGVGIGPVFPRPAYGYVAVPPRPYRYYARPYAYAPAYVPPAYFAYGHFDRDRRWDHRDWDRRDRDDYRGWRHYDRR
jgi:hypothetical protein